MATFEEGLQAQLDNGTIKKNSTFGRQVGRVLSIKNPSRRARVLARMEGHARVHMGVSADKPVNWTAATIDWKSILTMLLQLMPIILALFGL